MKLREIDLLQLINKKQNLDQCFVILPFLYTPFLKILKKKEFQISELILEFNCENISERHVLVSILRLFGNPQSGDKVDEKIILNYLDKRITVYCNTNGAVFSGSCELKEGLMTFSESTPYMMCQNRDKSESVIVLPEGEGLYYMKLDKKESEKAERLSIVGNPHAIKKHLKWYLDHING